MKNTGRKVENWCRKYKSNRAKSGEAGIMCLVPGKKHQRSRTTQDRKRDRWCGTRHEIRNAGSAVSSKTAHGRIKNRAQRLMGVRKNKKRVSKKRSD